MVTWLLLVTATVAVPGVIAPTAASAADTVTVFPSDDSSVRESRADTNYGGSSTLHLDSPPRDILLKFDLVGIDTTTVQNATLRLFNTNSSTAGGEFYTTTTSTWTENNVTWNNAPSTAGAPIGSLGAVSSNTWYELDITTAVLGDLDAIISLRTANFPTTNGAYYSSKENSNGNSPELVITHDTTPDTEPPTEPTNLTATAVTASSVTLDWDPANDNTAVVAYDIYRDGALLTSVSGATTSHTDTTVNPDTTYDYHAIARDAAGNTSPPSNTETITTPAGNPGGLVFDVTRDGTTSTYHAISRTTSSSYTGSVKFVVESASTELHAAGGGEVAFAAGDFDQGSEHFELRDLTDITYSGQGIDVTFIHNFTSEAADTEPFDSSLSDRIIVRDMTVDAGGSDRTTSDALDFDGGDDILIERVKITGSRGRGIIFDGKDAGQTAERNIVRDCVISGVSHDGIQLLASSNNRIENCVITDTERDGIRIHRSGSSAAQPHKPSNDNVIIGNYIENAGQDGIKINSGNRNLISGNTILNGSDDGSDYDGIVVTTDPSSLQCDDNEIHQNIVSDTQTTKTQRYGLNIERSSCNRTVVGDNDFSGNLLADINDDGTDTIYTSSDTEDPTAPQNLVATAVQASSVTMSWDAASDNVAVTGYDVYRDGGLIATVGAATTNHTDGSAIPDTTFQYTVRARDAAANVSVPSNTLTVTTPPGPATLTLAPTHDATVRASDPDTTYGLRPDLLVDASSQKDLLLMFQVPNLGASTVLSATLRLHVIDPSSSGGDFAIVVDTSWDEATVTWNNAPLGGTSVGSVGAVTVGEWVDLDLTGFVTGEGAFSVRASSTNSNGADYVSAEGTASLVPQLVLTLG